MGDHGAFSIASTQNIKNVYTHINYDYCFKFQAYMSACESYEKVKISTVFRARQPHNQILVRFAREREKIWKFRATKAIK